jgi:hypothetical protein
MNGLTDDKAPPEGLRVCDDMAFGKAPIGGVSSRPPVYNRNLAPPDLNAIYWLIRFRGYDTDNNPYLLLCDETYEDDRGRPISKLTGRFINQTLTELGEPIVLQDRRLPIADRDFAVQDENNVYFIGGGKPTTLERDSGNLVVRQMGYKSEDILTITSSTSGGSIDNGQHYYQLILTDKNGHRSAPIPLEDFGENNQITTTGSNASVVTLGGDGAGETMLPKCDGENKYLYRALTDIDITGRDPDNYPVFYLVKVLGGRVWTTDDSMSDATLATHEVLDMSGHLPPERLKNAIVHNGRMWGFEAESSVLRYTPQFNYENWPLLNAIPIGDPDYLEGIAAVGDRLLLFKKTKVYALWGDTIANFDYREVSSTYGTKYPKTIRTIDDNRAIFLDSQERVIMFSGGQFVDISRIIRLPESTLYWAVLFNDYYILWLYENGNRTGYAYYIPTGAWTRWRGINMHMAEEPNRPGLEYMVFWNGLSIGILGKGFPGFDENDPGQTYPLTLRTQNSDLGTATQKKSFKELELYFDLLDPTEAFEGTVGQLELIVDEANDLDASFQQTINYDSENPDKRQKFRISNGANGTRASVRFVGTNHMDKFALMQASIHWQPRGTPIR